MMFPNRRSVLLWTANSAADLSGLGFVTLKSIYTGMGVAVHTDTTWSETLADYGLIHFPLAASNPSWWGEIAGNTWDGRLHITADADNSAAGLASIAYVNGLSGITGISALGGLFPWETTNTAEPDDLTSGMSNIYAVAASDLSGGTTLSKKIVFSSSPWLARNKPVGSLADFVVSGDVDYATDLHIDINGSVAFRNQILFQKMWTVAV